MGVTALRDLSVINETTLDVYNGDVVAVDAHHWLFKYMTVQVRYMSEDYYTTSDGVEVPNLIGILRGIPTLLNANITPVFVFDGTAADLKRDEINQRKAAKRDAQEKMEQAKERGDVEAARRYKAQSQYLTDTIQQTSRELLELLGIPYVEATGAGEGYAAALAADDTTAITAAFSGDYDTLLFGSPHTVRSFTGNGPAEHIPLDETLATLDLTREQLVDAAILIGTDYNEGIHGIGPKRAVNYLQDGEDAVSIAADRGDDTLTPDVINAVRDIFLTPPTGTYDPGVLDTDPDYDAAQQYLVHDWELPEQTVHDNLNRFTNQA